MTEWIMWYEVRWLCVVNIKYDGCVWSTWSMMSVCGLQTNTGKRRRTGSIFSTKSHLSTGYRYRDGHLLNIVGSPVQESSHTYLFECFIGTTHFMITHDHTWITRVGISQCYFIVSSLARVLPRTIRWCALFIHSFIAICKAQYVENVESEVLTWCNVSSFSAIAHFHCSMTCCVCRVGR